MRVLSAAWLALRSLFWVLVLPGFVAFYAPWRYFGLSRVTLGVANPRHLIGSALATVGAVVLLICVYEFAKSGRGTLSPLDPPRQLVVRGLYRWVRNPMYVGVTTVLLGEALLIGTRAFVAYLAVWFVVVNLFIIAYEEPVLERQFGAEYAEYKRTVGRWLPRRSA